MVSRPRIASRLEDLIERAPVTFICATAGAGKTTAVLEVALRSRRPVAWLSVDDTDQAPGRLLTYLQSALSQVAAGVGTVGTDVLSEGAGHVEAAGLIADAVGDEPVLLVLDELDRIAVAPQALAVVNAVLRYARPTMRVVCVSRTEIELDPGSTDRLTRIAALGEEDLAFTIDEATIALRDVCESDVDPVAAVAATGGWVTGVLFEAWRSEEHRYGAGGDADPLHGYLGSQILARLSDAERDLLVTTSVLDEISAADAMKLGVDNARDVLYGLRKQRLPGWWSQDGSRFRPHTRLREFLRACLGRRSEAEVRRIGVAHGELLAEAQRYEEATEAFINAGELARAATVAERAIFGVIERGDLLIGERWIGTFDEATMSGSRALMEAELMLHNARDDFNCAQVAADRLVGTYRRSGEQIPGRTFGLVAWCYFMAGRVEDASVVRALAAPSPEASLVACACDLAVGAPGIRIADIPDNFGCGLDDVTLRRAQLAHGRLQQALARVRAPWWRLVNAPYYIEALLAAGRISEALSVYGELKSRGVEGAYLGGCVAPSLLAAAGRNEEAMEALAEARERVIASGSVVYHIRHLLTESQLALRINRDTSRAQLALARVSQLRGADQLLSARVGVPLWDGMRMLIDGLDAAAYQSLRAAVDLARAHDQLLDLVAAAVYLSEAAWRCGEESDADAAADLALSTSKSMGSNQLLMLALRDFPAVAARRLDAERGADTEWHAIARALSGGQGPRGTDEALVTVDDLGELRVEIAGEVVTARLRKSLELLAFLASRPDGRANREELLEALFDGRADDSAGAYLRQALTRLRGVLPDAVLSRDLDGTLQLAPGAVLSRARGLEMRIADASGLAGADRREALSDAVGGIGNESYLMDVDAPWAQDRREQIDATILRARMDIAQLAFEAGDLTEAEERAATVVAIDPYRESAWRLLMRVRSMLGDDDGVIATFRACARSLEGVGIGPADSTRDLLVALRR
jgi:DNA-binding SARP family transcriptional activator/tetratricopeptide (TPR) repeat protein